MEKKKPNPNPNHSNKLPRRNLWSEISPDLLEPVLNRLGFADFQRAKSVCSSWYSVSKQCVPKKNQIPWLILFPEYNNNNNTSCSLFNPEEKDKLYKTQDLGLEFAKSVFISTYESWLLMCDPLYNLYLLNLFTHERISLPLLPPLCQRMPSKGWENPDIDIQSPVFWIDDKTKDYVLLGNSSTDHKLYFLSSSGRFKIFDFSGELPQQTFECDVFMNRVHNVDNSLQAICTKLVVRVTGDVLKVERRLHHGFSTFRVDKVYSSSRPVNEAIDSLDDEAMLFELGITVLANGIEGLKRNSIYFNGSHEKNKTEIYIFNLETKKLESLHKFVCSSVQLSRARWFLPSFKRT